MDRRTRPLLTALSLRDDAGSAPDSDSELVRLLVGPEQREFVVHRPLLAACSAVISDCIDTASPDSAAAAATPPAGALYVPWLAAESAGMFEIFVLWLYRGRAFGSVINDAVASLLASEDVDDLAIELLPEEDEDEDEEYDEEYDEAETARACSDLHWNLVNAHLFAARADIPAFQDAVMDALQDLYLRLDWEATPLLIRFLYIDCPDAVAACRLRKWAVALLAWTLANSIEGDALDADEADDDDSDYEDADYYDDRCADERRLRRLLRSHHALRAEYTAQIAKLTASGADVRFKNPQLRIPSNHLRREDRLFGFRQCSFHSHRRAVGQGRCPHSPRLPPPLPVFSSSTARTIHRPGHHRAVRSVDDSASTRPRRMFVAASPTTSLSRSLSHSAASPSSVMSSPVSSSTSAFSLPFSLPTRSSTSEPRLVDLPAWSPLSNTPSTGLAPLGMELTT